MPTPEWQRYKQYLCTCPSIGLSLDISRMAFDDGFFGHMSKRMDQAFAAMDQLESGAIANPDEKRMVGHYWLRDADRAPNAAIRDQIKRALAAVKQFAADVHTGKITSQRGTLFDAILIIGIGGSALGPQFVADALGSSSDRMKVFFLDNTDPDGIDKTIAQIPALARTLSIVISKSGGTKETRNGMLAAAAAYQRAGLEFPRHAVAITGEGSQLDQTAVSEKWLARFPMWDWVGGRTSELSAVGLLPACLQGIDIDAILAGARDTDQIGRLYGTNHNPAALLALMWYSAGQGKGLKDMVVLPYKDRLLLFSRYLQQLIMESLGKEKDLQGHVVHQGIAVYGNKGSTDQHAYVQQLREGINNFFVTFIEVLQDRADVHGAIKPSSSTHAEMPQDSAALVVEPQGGGVTSGDYLHGFFQGTRAALSENGRENMTITIDAISPRAIGVLIALFERAVGIYASLININAYHQPGVEAGKKAATAVINLQAKVLEYLRGGKQGTAQQIATAIHASDQVETVHLTLRHLAANGRGITTEGDDFFTRVYRGA